MVRDLDIKEFAQRVERMCEFFLAKISAEGRRDGSKDVMVIETLKDDAADIQFDRVNLKSEIFSGLYDAMFGVPEPPEEPQ